MCSYAFSQCPEGPASGPDTLLEGQTSCIFCRFSDPPVDVRLVISSFPVNYRDDSLTVYILRAEFFDPPGAPGHPGGHPGLHRCLYEIGDPCF
ncbi:hypothetical protein AYI70_g349 [Smittium culicis]|uniref:Uncharacterized protein n=1 Tax=Smittium culicis TaxID=133412 RepID=A0A1R1YH18_9FUNG|nr:hypothetical protein AYI70_g349 [Smittium culicis]